MTTNPDRANFDLVIFDCDGVLVDSEVISCRAHAETLTRYGYPITEEQVLEQFLGISDREARLIVEAEIGRKLPDDFEAQVNSSTLRFYADDLRAISNVGAAIAAIGLPKCVASSSTPEKIRHGLTCAGLYDTFAPAYSRRPRSSAASRHRTCFCSLPADAGICRTVCGNRGQRARCHRGACRRNERAGLSRRQPLPPRLCREAAGRRRGPGPLTICGNCRI